jgi:hypothetical protein
MRRRMTRARWMAVTLTLFAVGMVWITVLDRPPARPPLRPGSPAAPARLIAPATAREVLARGDVLALTDDQRARLAALAKAWEQDIAPVDAALKVATDEFTRFARDARQSGRARLEDIRSRTEDVQSLSALMRERRTRHADETMATLTAAQRAHLTELRQMTGGTR